MKVSELMCRPVASCTEETDLPSAARRMAENDCGVLPVLRGNRVVGVVSDRDICLAIGTRKPAASTLVKDIMSRSVATCTTTDDVAGALAAMAARHVRRLPVLDAKGSLVGILSLDDVVLRAEDPVPGGVPPGVTCSDVVRTFRAVAGSRPVRRSA